MKKPFKETAIGKILVAATSVINPALGRLVEGSISVSDALSTIKASNLPPDTKERLQELALEGQKELTKRLESDNKQDSWLPRNIRPLTLIVLTASYVAGFFFKFDVSVMNAPLMAVFSFYFVGRSAEKIYQ